MNKELMQIIESNDIEKLEKLIASGLDIKKERGEGGMTPYLYAARFGKVEILAHLLKKNYANKNEKAADGNTALLYAADDGHIPMVEFLLKNKLSSVKEKDIFGWTPLLRAANGGQIAMVDYLLSNHYSNVDERSLRGSTAILLAIKAGNMKLVKLLLTKYQADPEICIDGKNALFYAAYFDRVEILEYLLEKGCYITINSKKYSEYSNAVNNILNAANDLLHGRYPSTGRWDTDALDFLGKGLNARLFENGHTGLHIAILKSKFNLVRNLVEKGADMFIPDRNDETPAMLLSTSQDPYFLCLYGFFNLGKIEKEIVAIRTQQSQMKDVKEKKELKEVKEIKETKEHQGISSLEQLAIQTLELQAKQWIKDIKTHLEKVDKEDIKHLCLTIAKLLMNVKSPLFDLAAAYQLLDHSVSKYNDSLRQQETREFIIEILISPKVVFKKNQAGDFNCEPIPSDKLFEETKESLEYRLSCIINHIGNISQTPKENNIKKYIFGDEKSLAEIERQKETSSLGINMALVKKVKSRIDELNEIVKKNDIETLEQLIKSGVDIKNHKMDNDGTTLLHYAAMKGFSSMVSYLLENGYAQVEEVDDRNCTALLFAAKYNQISVINVLLEKWKPKIDAKCGYENNILTLAKEHPNCIAYLLERGAAYIDLLTEYGTTSAKISQLLSNDHPSMILVNAACDLVDLARSKNGGEFLGTVLKSLGKAVNGRTIKNGNTALHFAISENNISVVRGLFNNGADFFIKNHNGETPLSLLGKSENPYLIAFHSYFSLCQIEKNVNELSEKQSASSSTEIKKLKESQLQMLKEAKETKEKREISSAPILDINTLETECKKYLAIFQRLLPKLDKEDRAMLCLKMGQLLSTVDSPLLNASRAYYFLNLIVEENMPDPYLTEASKGILEILVSKRIIFVFDQESEKPNYENSTSSLQEEEESGQAFDHRMELIIKLMLQCNSIHDESLYGYITHYVNGNSDSLIKLEDLKGKGLDLNMSLIRTLKKRVEEKREMEQSYQKKFKEQEAEIAKLRLEVEQLKKRNQDSNLLVAFQAGKSATSGQVSAVNIKLTQT